MGNNMFAGMGGQGQGQQSNNMMFGGQQSQQTNNMFGGSGPGMQQKPQLNCDLTGMMGGTVTDQYLQKYPGTPQNKSLKARQMEGGSGSVALTKPGGFADLDPFAL